MDLKKPEEEPTQDQETMSGEEEEEILDETGDDRRLLSSGINRDLAASTASEETFHGTLEWHSVTGLLVSGPVIGARGFFIYHFHCY